MNAGTCLSLLVLLSIAAGGASAHIDNPMLPEGCGSCHVGHGKDREPMLDASEEAFCYQCHGSELKQSVMRSTGRLAQSAEPADIETVFKEVYRHPVEQSLGHSPGERLPDVSRASVNHAECVDCHNPHQRTHKGGSVVYEVTGYSLAGQYLETSAYEYEICFKCHSGTVGISSVSKDYRREFSISSVSQHPVTRITVGGRTVSLSSRLAAGTEMRCSDCHTNDDPSGPRGPHGSRYRFMLSGNYETDIYSEESAFAYQFCYSCHDRMSILANESFPLHRQHILGDPLDAIPGTSCFTCHASHSSESYPFLIDFNSEAVSTDGTTGRIMYNPAGDRSGECYLTCHGHEHSPGRY